MKKIILSILFLAAAGAVSAQKTKKGAASAASPQAAKSLPLGSSIPMEGVMMQSAVGPHTSLMQAKKEKGLLVMFSCNTCPYVIKAQGATKEAMDVAKDLRIGMIVVNSNEAQRNDEDALQRMTEYAEIHKYTAPYVIDQDSRLADAFGATRTPEVYLFNGKGKLVYKGALEDNPADPGKSTQHYVAAALKLLADDKPMQKTETKSIGCSIKRVGQ